MKAVLMSVHPKWCEKIASGKKTIEVRKTRPSIKTPFKVYIYETKDKKYFNTGIYFENGKVVFLHRCGSVIGEFICDEIIEVDLDSVGVFNRETKARIHQETCLSRKEAAKYLGYLCGYGYHISELKIYDEPMELSEFWEADKCPYASTEGCTYQYYCFRAGAAKRCGDTLDRPPQSWCYVNERKLSKRGTGGRRNEQIH